MKGTITISTALSWRKTLTERHSELVGLRNANAVRETRYYGANVDKEKVIDPLYDVVALDNQITKIAVEIRKLDEAVKETNQTTSVKDYERNEEVLGTLVAAKPDKKSTK